MNIDRLLYGFAAGKSGTKTNFAIAAIAASFANLQHFH